MTGIIVGVDGSDPSRQALRWAMREAVLRRVPLTVMSVRPDPVRPATMVYWGLRAIPESSPDEDQARARVQEFVDKVVSETGEAAVPEIAVSVPTGNAAEELVRASREAEMLVVGCRGHGGFGTLLMGSVSHQVTLHAACPVVIVRGSR
jgi:nucleotide-binding universal stress UspA family protein